MAPKTIAIIALAALASSASALDYSITNPIKSTLWPKTGPATVSWLVSDTENTAFPAAETAEVALMKCNGNCDAAKLIGVMGTAPAASGKFEGTVPEGVTEGNDYFIRLGGAGTPAYYRYSSAFCIGSCTVATKDPVPPTSSKTTEKKPTTESTTSSATSMALTGLGLVAAGIAGITQLL